jgi:glycerol-3-phosphate acyltransferase PlsX
MKPIIAVDGMGGDHAPSAVVDGMKLFMREDRLTEFLLVGPEQEMRRLLHSENPRTLSYLHCTHYIPMDSKLTLGIFKQKDTTIHEVLRLLKEGRANVAYSAGNTALFVSLAVGKLGMIRGIERPSICVHLPNLRGGTTLFLDVGANVSPKVNQLVQSAFMGDLYAREVLGIKEPKIGLLNIGEEENKGDELRQKTYRILASEKRLSFVGNIEGHEIFSGKTDILVTDGFNGNMILKVSEGMVKSFKSMLVRGMHESFRGRIGMAIAQNSLKNFAKAFDYSAYGGGVLLGVDGVVIISHGRSSPRAIYNGLTMGRTMIDRTFLTKLKEASSQWTMP